MSGRLRKEYPYHLSAAEAICSVGGVLDLQTYRRQTELTNENVSISGVVVLFAVDV